MGKRETRRGAADRDGSTDKTSRAKLGGDLHAGPCTWNEEGLGMQSVHRVTLRREGRTGWIPCEFVTCLVGEEEMDGGRWLGEACSFLLCNPEGHLFLPYTSIQR